MTTFHLSRQARLHFPGHLAKTLKRVFRWRLLMTLWLLSLGFESRAMVWTTNSESAFAQEHVFMVRADGWCIDPRAKWGLPGAIKSDDQYHIYQDCLNVIKAGVSNWCQTNKAPDKRVVVFVHGGLNPYSASFERMTNLGPLMLKDNCYPIFVVWNSGLISAYGEHLVKIRQGEEHPVIGWATFPVVLTYDLAKGIIRLPLTQTAQWYNDLRTTELPRDCTNWNAVATARWEGFEYLIHSNVPDLYHPPLPEGNKRTWANRDVRLAEYILTTPTKVATLPILDSLGTEAWNDMLRRTRTMFELASVYDTGTKIKKWGTENPNSTNLQSVSRWLGIKTNEDQTTTIFNDPNNRRGAMALFGRQLADWTTNPSSFSNFNCNVNFEFYGHSMGAIVLNQLFANVPTIKTPRIVYLAAACTIEDYENALFPYLKNNRGTQFYSLSLHRMSEREEYSLSSVPGVRDVPVLRDLVTRGSLLIWIDDIFADPHTMSDRTLGDWENCTSALPDVPVDLRKPGPQGQVHFRDCEIEQISPWGTLSGTYEPQAHGEFGRARFWDSHFVWPDGTNTLYLIGSEPGKATRSNPR